MRIPSSETRVVELRVHGILGTSSDALTDAVASVDVAGDGVGRIVRPADKLRRPVAGPELTAGDRTVPRIVEGYLWEGMTSGWFAKLSWALLFPFALANMAHWMLPSTRAATGFPRVASAGLRALLRVAALLLTMLFLSQLGVLSLDLLAAQCLAPESGCLGFVPAEFRGLPFLKAGVALAVLALVIAAMRRLSTVSWKVQQTQPGNSTQNEGNPGQLGANVVADPDTPVLRAMHVIAALSTVVVLALGPGWDPRWIAALALIGYTLLGSAIVDDPARTNIVFGSLVRRVLLVAASVVFASVLVVPPSLGENGGAAALAGSEVTVSALVAALLVVCLAVTLLLIPVALAARGQWSHLPRALRPWAGGGMSAAVLVVAVLLGSGLGAGLALGLELALGTDLTLPTVYTAIPAFWGLATVAGAGAGIVVALVTALRRWRKGPGVPPHVALLHAGRSQDQQAAARAWGRAELLHQLPHRIMLAVAGMMSAAVVGTVVCGLLGVPLRWPGWTVALGATSVLAVLAVLLQVIFQPASARQLTRYIGVLCDLTLFWPREAHPIVPPCYPLKVLPELVDRAQEHLSDPNTRVVLVGTGQGSLLTAMAAARLVNAVPEADRERIGLVSAGSQLQWAYPRAFPAVVSHDSLRTLAALLGQQWRSLCRGTDPIGGAVTTWNRQVYDGMLIGVGLRPDGSVGPLHAASRGPTGALVLGSDHWLPDPQRGPVTSRRWSPGVLGHREYSGDPEWDRAVAMAAGLEAAPRSSALALRDGNGAGEELAGAVTVATQNGNSAPASSPTRKLADRTSGQARAPEPVVSSRSQALLDAAAAKAQASGSKVDAELVRRATQASPLPEIHEPASRPAPWERAQGQK